MGYSSGEGFEYLSEHIKLLCVTRQRAEQYHADIVGRSGETERVRRWCLANFGPPIIWHPRNKDTQWHNRFETDLFRSDNWRWACLRSPWIGGDVENIHMVLWDRARWDFEDRWSRHFFSRSSSNRSIRSSGV